MDLEEIDLRFYAMPRTAVRTPNWVDKFVLEAKTLFLNKHNELRFCWYPGYINYYYTFRSLRFHQSTLYVFISVLRMSGRFNVFVVVGPIYTFITTQEVAKKKKKNDNIIYILFDCE